MLRNVATEADLYMPAESDTSTWVSAAPDAEVQR